MMQATCTTDEMRDLPGGSHVCWIVEDADPYASLARDLVTAGRDAGQKTFVFGPQGSPDRARLGPGAALAADPRLDFLDGGPLDPDVMLRTFERETAAARDEGYRGLRIVADMDWLRPLSVTSEEIVEFELLVDSLVAELDATIVCAYRRSSFERSFIEGALAVHPVIVTAEDAPFRFVAAERGSWRLSGEVDLAAAEMFEAAFRTAAGQQPCLVDVADLTFIDVAGMRAIARLAASCDDAVVLTGASSTFRRVWDLSGLGASAPRLRLDA